MTSKQKIQDAILDPLGTFGSKDPTSSYSKYENMVGFTGLEIGIVEQFNVGLYSVLVSTPRKSYVCSVGTLNVAPGLGYSDDTVLTEGDMVIFALIDDTSVDGLILAKRPSRHSVKATHPLTIKSDTQQDRRTSYFSNDCYRKKVSAYDTPLTSPSDISTGRYINNRPTDLVPGETGTLNPHHNGLLHNMYSTTLCGGGSHIRMFSLENRIRVVADSIIKYTLFGNEEEWHNRRYLSRERAACMYQEERLGMSGENEVAFEECDYHDDLYFTKNKKKRQTLKPRLLEQEGYYGGMSARYCLRPDPAMKDPRTKDDKPRDPGVFRESVDPSGQYRLASAGMIGLERIGRIPVPVRTRAPWHDKAEEPDRQNRTLQEFKHDEHHPYYRQLELADRVAYDLKNSYARLDGAPTEFYVPQEEDLEGQVKDVYDKDFTDSITVKLEKYDKRRSGIWQGEDGSIIIRDAWGSEIVMIGGNIQLSCAGNVEILPGKTALTLAGDDIVHKAQNSIDISSADKDVRVNAYKNVQVLAGVDDDHPGGITLEARGTAGPWGGVSLASLDPTSGGETLGSSGILLKSHEGTVVTDAKDVILKSTKQTSLVSGDGKIAGGEGSIRLSADDVHALGKSVNLLSEDGALVLGETAILAAGSVVVCGDKSASVFQGMDMMIPLMWASGDKNVAADTLESLDPLVQLMRDEAKVAVGYTSEQLENMSFQFRSSAECGTSTGWELNGPSKFTLYQPFWTQVASKFETLRGVGLKSFDDHEDLWTEKTGNPWPGRDAVVNKQAKYAKLEKGAPQNLDKNGLNNSRKLVMASSPVVEQDLFPGYQIRES